MKGNVEGKGKNGKGGGIWGPPDLQIFQHSRVTSGLYFYNAKDHKPTKGLFQDTTESTTTFYNFF